MNIPFYSQIQALVKEGGFDAYLVGGCVRDVILGRDVNDIDMVCLSHDYRDFAQAVRILLPSAWVEFKDNVRLVCPNLEIDISKPRGETIEEDLLKRDFTINNLAMDFDGAVIGDDTDIKNRRIRHVTEESFSDDPLRMLRAFRFQSQLGFDIAEETRLKIKAEKYTIEQSARERVLQELVKLFTGEKAASALIEMHECGLYELIFEKCGFTCLAVEAAKTGKGLEFFLSALMTGAENRDVLTALCLSNAAARKVTRTAEAADTLAQSSGKDSDDIEIRKLIYAYPDELEDALMLMELMKRCMGESCWKTELYVHKVMMETKNVDFELPMMLNGGFLMTMGISAGKLMGEIINEMRPMLASGEIRDMDDAEKYIKNKYLQG